MPNPFSGKTTLQRGHEAEDAALHFLRGQGLKPLTRNFRTQMGELDLIMLDGKELVFIEVRLRTDSRFGGGLASITRTKRQRLIRTAQLYLQKCTLRYAGCRFDVVCLTGDNSAAPPTWIRNAFLIDE